MRNIFGVIASIFGLPLDGGSDRMRSRMKFQFATGVRLYRILHYKKPDFYRPKLGKNKRRVLYARQQKPRNKFFK